MSERRIADFGRFHQAEDINEANSYLWGPGVLTGNEMSVSTDGSEVEVAAGSVITNDGVIIINDGVRDFPVSPQSDPTIFTLVQYHTFSLSAGGNESSYGTVEYLDGSDPKFGTYADVVDSDGNINGVILGWIRYPGGNVDYESYMLHSPPPMQVTNPLVTVPNGEPAYTPFNYLAPFTDAHGCFAVLDADISVAHAIDANALAETTWTNDHAGTTETAIVYLGMQQEAVYQPRMVDLRGVAVSDPTVSIEVAIVTSAGATVLGTLTGAVSANNNIAIPDSVFPGGAPADSGETAVLRITATLPPTESFTLQRASVYATPLPYEA